MFLILTLLLVGCGRDSIQTSDSYTSNEEEQPLKLLKKSLTEKYGDIFAIDYEANENLFTLQPIGDDFILKMDKLIEYGFGTEEWNEMIDDMVNFLKVNSTSEGLSSTYTVRIVDPHKKEKLAEIVAGELVFDHFRGDWIDELQEKQTETEEPGTELNEVKRNNNNPKHFVRDRRFGNTESNFEISEDSDEIEIILEMIRDFFDHEFNEQVDTWYSENTNQFIIHSTNSLLEEQYFEAITNGNPNPITEWEYTTIHLSKRIQSLTETDYTVSLRHPTDSGYVLFEARNGNPIYNYFKDSDYQENY